ncbi:MAG TPA: transporter substrate-binding domain-containing protein [Noviherbaspirillum sp.]|nr:transporter substrate-binding domain-containing protein [Noviherbaspirillum sp.]
MQRLRRSLVICLASAPFILARAERMVRLAIGEWPPFLSEHLPHYGIGSRIITEAFAAQGLRVQYGFFPWRRSLRLAQSGEWDGTALWLKSEARMRDFYFSEPVMYAEYVFFHRKTMPFDWSQITDLVEYRIGISNDYFYGKEFECAVKAGLVNVESVPKDELNLRKLLHGRIDLFPMDRVAGNALLQERFTPEESRLLTAHPRPLYHDAMYLLLGRKRPQNRQLTRTFNAGLEGLRASGKLEAYLKEALR